MKGPIKWIINIAVIFIFGYFAIVQLNDPDSWQWVITYAIIIYLAIRHLMNRLSSGTALFIFLFYSIIMMILSPALFEWLSLDCPDFIDYHPSQLDVAEKMREFLGIAICCLTAAGYYISRKVEHKKNP